MSGRCEGCGNNRRYCECVSEHEVDEMRDRIATLEAALRGLVGDAEHYLRATRLDGPRTRALVKRIDRAKGALDES
jgi:hypothetical protein